MSVHTHIYMKLSQHFDVFQLFGYWDVILSRINP